MTRVLILALAVSTLLACGVSVPADAPAPEEAAEEVGGPTPQAAKMTPSPTEERVTEGLAALDPFWGQTTVKEKVAYSDIIVRATMTSFTAEIDTANGVFIKFNLDVREYLMGTGPSSIVAVWVDRSSQSARATRAAAEARKATVLAKRDSQWDDREAIIFLNDWDTDDFGPTIAGLLKQADHFFLGYGDPHHDDDYSLHSKSSRQWLPSAAAVSSSGADSNAAARTYLLDVPPNSEGSVGQSSSSQTPTVTLADLKAKIQEIAAEIDDADSSEAHAYCITAKYSLQQEERQLELEGRALARKRPAQTELESGQPAGTLLHQRPRSGKYPDQKSKTWFEGPDAALLVVVQGATTPYDVDGDGKFTAGVDGIAFTERLTTARPLPAGKYSVVRKEVWTIFLACNHVLDSDWTITVTAPSGTLHEMFFDPVTVGTAVAADATSGVLKPRAFTTVSGTAATISRIAYEPSSGSGKSAQVKIEVTPDDALTGHVVDFIGLDGTVSLTLSVAAATVDAVNDTLSWATASQPWKAGDKLMVRARAAPPAPAVPTGLTATSGNASVTLTWGDPSNSTITGYEYQMRWTGVGWQDWVAIPSSGASTTSYTVTGLTNGTEYRFHLRAVNAGGAGQAAPGADPWYVAATPQPPPPAAPTGLTATAGKGSVTLTWDDPSNSSITRYEYQMRWTGVGWQGWVAIPNSGAKTTSYEVRGLTNGTEYRFHLRAVNAGGAGQVAPNAHPWYVAAAPPGGGG